MMRKHQLPAGDGLGSSHGRAGMAPGPTWAVSPATHRLVAQVTQNRMTPQLIAALQTAA